MDIVSILEWSFKVYVIIIAVMAVLYPVINLYRLNKYIYKSAVIGALSWTNKVTVYTINYMKYKGLDRVINYDVKGSTYSMNYYKFLLKLSMSKYLHLE